MQSLFSAEVNTRRFFSGKTKLEESLMYFDNYQSKQRVPYIIYADFESILVPIPSCQPNSVSSFTQKINNHVPCGYAYIIIDSNGKSLKPISCYRGVNAVDHFLEELIKEKDILAQKLTYTVPLIMTPQNEEDFQRADLCFLCKKKLNRDRVRDHDHLTGLYRGALHNSCNLKYRLNKKIPVVFHNLRNYDAHLIMQGFKKIKDHEISVIANNMEKYISFSLSKKHNKSRITLQFVDSFQFMSTSLEKLVDNLPHNQFKILNENITSHVSLLLKKGVYPYEYMSSFNKFEETELPPRSAFYSSLTDETVSAEEYAHAQAVWSTFNIGNLGEYHNLYVRVDVLQLADVFENFRKLCLNFYEIDCAHFLTAPGMTWQAALKMTQQPLELFTDVDIHLFIERGIRGGIATISKRWACANNKYVEQFDPTKPEKHVIYLDANNLYGWAMSQLLPYGEFEWGSPNVTVDWIMSLKEDAEVGYIFEVDLEYPHYLHDSHSEYPLAAKKVKISRYAISIYEPTN